MWIYWPGFEICKIFQIITDLAKKYQYQSQFALIDMFQKISGRLEKREYQSIFLNQGDNDKIDIQNISLLPVISKTFERVIYMKTLYLMYGLEEVRFSVKS